MVSLCFILTFLLLSFYSALFCSALMLSVSLSLSILFLSIFSVLGMLLFSFLNSNHSLAISPSCPKSPAMKWLLVSRSPWSHTIMIHVFDHCLATEEVTREDTSISIYLGAYF